MLSDQERRGAGVDGAFALVPRGLSSRREPPPRRWRRFHRHYPPKQGLVFFSLSGLRFWGFGVDCGGGWRVTGDSGGQETGLQVAVRQGHIEVVREWVARKLPLDAQEHVRHS